MDAASAAVLQAYMNQGVSAEAVQAALVQTQAAQALLQATQTGMLVAVPMVPAIASSDADGIGIQCLLQTSPAALAAAAAAAHAASVPEQPGVFAAQGFTNDVVRILCYGDSLTCGFCLGGSYYEPYGRNFANQLGMAGISCEVSVCGLSGRCAHEMARDAGGAMLDVTGRCGKGLARALEENGPFHLVVIMAGTNDLGQGMQQQVTAENLRHLHGLCHLRGVPTVALAPPPAPCGAVGWEQGRQALLGLMRQMCSTMPGVVECMDPSELMPAALPDVWDPDGLHFSPLGSSALGLGLAGWAAARFATAGASAPPAPPQPSADESGADAEQPTWSHASQFGGFGSFEQQAAVDAQPWGMVHA